MAVARRNRELVVDLFAGGGGASTGVANAIGRDPDIAINHDAAALAMHEANHPDSRHYRENIWGVDPVEACAGRPVGLLWASPDCKHFSKAKGGKPRDKNIRALAGVVPMWARLVKPRVIILENVEEFKTWGPLDDHGHPIKERRGETFAEWLQELHDLGYEVEYRELRASEYGAPTIRKRLFIIARCDGGAIVWPEPTHGPVEPGRLIQDLQPYRTAAECIDWEIPCPSIFERSKPLAEATLRRIARGIQRFVIDNPRPFIVPLTHQGGDRTSSIDEPVKTVTGAHRGEQAVVVPTLIQTGYGEREGQAPRSLDIEQPLGTVVAQGGKHALVAPYAVHVAHGEESPSGVKRWGKGDRDLEDPMPTLTASPDMAVVAPFLARTAYKGANGSYVNSVEEPVRTITAQDDGASVVTPFLTRFNQNGVGSELSEPIDTVMAGAPRFGLTAPVVVRMNHDGMGKPADAVDEPLRTVTTQHNHLNVAAAFLAKHNGGHEATGSDLGAPVHTVTAQDHHSLVAGHLTKLYGTSEAGVPVDEPAPTVTSEGQHIGAVYAFLTHYFSGGGQQQSAEEPLHAVTTKDRVALVYVEGEPYAIVDIGMRMLTPRELFRAQGFPEDYVIDAEYEAVDARGRTKRKRLTKTDQIRMCGNSVCPPVAEALVSANYRRVAVDGAEAAG